MGDREFLIWLHARLECVHGESPAMDYMHKLRAMIKNMDRQQCTPNMGSGNRIEDVL